jgi:hypothetical protein
MIFLLARYHKISNLKLENLVENSAKQKTLICSGLNEKLT